MDPNWPNFNEPDRSTNHTGTIGMVLLALGVLLGGWVVTIIYRLISGDGTREIVANLVPLESIEITIKGSSEVILVPESFYYMVGIFFCILLLAICGSMAKVLITNGVKMFQPDIPHAIEKFRKELKGQRETRR